MSKITVVDLGNMSIKYKGEAKRGNFSSRIKTSYQAYSEGLNRIEYNNRTTCIGIGELSREFNKVNKVWIPQMLFAIAECNEDKNEISTNITTLLPALQMEQKNKIVEELALKEFKFKKNGVDKVVKINKVMVLPEGFATFYSLSEEKQEKDILIVDIGSRTINICSFVNGELELIETITLGTFDFYNKIRTRENAKGKNYSEEDAKKGIDNGTITITNAERDSFFRDILDMIKGYTNLELYNKVIFTGGGSLLLEESIKNSANKSYEIHEDPVNSNVDGAYEASKLAWSDNS